MAVRTLAIVTGIVGDIVLTPEQAGMDIVSLQGHPSSPFVVVVPDGVQEWLFNNQTEQVAWIQSEVGSPASVLPGRNQNVWLDSAGNANNET